MRALAHYKRIKGIKRSVWGPRTKSNMRYGKQKGRRRRKTVGRKQQILFIAQSSYIYRYACVQMWEHIWIPCVVCTVHMILSAWFFFSLARVNRKIYVGRTVCRLHLNWLPLHIFAFVCNVAYGFCYTARGGVVVVGTGGVRKGRVWNSSIYQPTCNNIDVDFMIRIELHKFISTQLIISVSSCSAFAFFFDILFFIFILSFALFNTHRLCPFFLVHVCEVCAPWHGICL